MIYLGPPVSRPRPHIFIPSVNKGPVLGETFGGVTWFQWKWRGEQSSLTEFKGDYRKFYCNDRGSLEYYKVLWGFRVNFMLSKPNLPPSDPPSKY